MKYARFTLNLTLAVSAAVWQAPLLIAPALSANPAPPTAPSRLARPGANVQKSGETLTGSVSQSALNAARLKRDDSAGASTGANPLVAAPAPVNNQSGSLFSDGDKNAFATVDTQPRAVAPTYVPQAQTRTTSSTTSGAATTDRASSSDSAGDTLRKGLKLFSKLQQDYRQSPMLQAGARTLLNNVGNSQAQLPRGTSLSGSASSSISRILPGKFAGRVLNKQELTLLGNYEVAVIIDKSGSMNETDCPGNTSRWDWCNAQLGNFANQTASVFKNGITVALFSSNSQMFKNVDFSTVSRIFSNNSPSGGTYMSRPLSEVLDEYFERRDHSPSSVRKLLIEVISDGEPSDKGDVVATISRATSRMTRPDEIRINFIQIGNERDGIDALTRFDTNLVGEGALYDIVSVTPFASVAVGGLPGTMADAARR